MEFLQLVPRLVWPEQFGGRAQDAFHVVCPSVAGFGFSSASSGAGMNSAVIAQRHAKLMAALGYDRYIAQGGDLGSGISRLMAALDPEHCRAIHLNLISVAPPAGVADPMALALPGELELLRRCEQHRLEGSAYQVLQSTRPQTLAFALQDSPVGLCAWIADKFQAWSDCAGELRNAVSWNRLLANVSLYWFTGTIGSSMRLYRENALARAAGALPLGALDVPVGVAVYPREIHYSPRAWVERSLRVVHWSIAEKGGHFAALEQPQAFAEDLWRFRKSLEATESA